MLCFLARGFTPDEIATIGAMVASLDNRHVPTGRLPLPGQRSYAPGAAPRPVATGVEGLRWVLRWPAEVAGQVNGGTVGERASVRAFCGARRRCKLL